MFCRFFLLLIESAFPIFFGRYFKEHWPERMPVYSLSSCLLGLSNSFALKLKCEQEWQVRFCQWKTFRFGCHFMINFLKLLFESQQWIEKLCLLLLVGFPRSFRVHKRFHTEWNFITLDIMAFIAEILSVIILASFVPYWRVYRA